MFMIMISLKNNNSRRMITHQWNLSMGFFLCSVFALATPEELEEALTNWRKCINDGTADQVIE